MWDNEFLQIEICGDDEMRKTTIAEACTLHARIGWQGLTKKEYLDEGDYYLVTGVDFDNGHIAFDSCHYVTKDRYDQDQHIQLHMDDILVTKDGTIGKVAIIDEPIEKPATLNSGVFVVRPKDKATLLPKYLMYVLQSNHFNSFIERIKVGCTIAHLNQEKFYQFEFPLPPVDDQEKIIKVFDTMFSVLYARKLEIQKLDELIKARFVEMFGLPVSNSKGWPTEQMSDIAPAVNCSGEHDDEVWLLNLDMVEAQTGRILDYLMVSNDEVGNSTCSFDTSNVLYSKLRPYLNKVVIPDRCGYATSELVPLQPVKTKMNREYLAFMLRSDEFVNMITEKVAGAKMPRVSMGDFRKFDVPIPPLDLQIQFADFVKQVDKSKVIVMKMLLQVFFMNLRERTYG